MEDGAGTDIQGPEIYYLFAEWISSSFLCLFRYLAISSELSHLVTAMNLIQKKMSPPWRHRGRTYRFLIIYLKRNSCHCLVYLIIFSAFFFLTCESELVCETLTFINTVYDSNIVPTEKGENFVIFPNC